MKQNLEDALHGRPMTDINIKTLSSHLADYLDYLKAINYSEHTSATVRRNNRRWLMWLEKCHQIETADQLRKEHLESWQKHLAAWQTHKGTPLKAKSINRSIDTARSFLKYLAIHGYVTNTLVDGLRYVKEPQMLPGSVLTHVEMKKLLSHVDTTTPEGYRNRAMLELLYTTGVRIGEMLALDVEDVDLALGTARVLGKGKKERIVPVGKTALKFIESYLVAVRPFLLTDKSERALFVHRGRRLLYQIFLRMVHTAADRAKLEKHVSPHTFRRSCTTELIRGGANMYHVKELLGHESLATLKHYARLTILDLKKTHEKCHPREREAQT